MAAFKENSSFVDLTGVVIAFSHLLRPNNSCVLIRILSSVPLNIIVRLPQQLLWVRSLKIGVTFRFTRLIPCYLFKGNTSQMRAFQTSVLSEMHAVMAVPQKHVLDVCSTSISYSGKVMEDSLDIFGLYKLDGDFVLCTAFVKEVTNILLKVNDYITIYKGHVRVINGERYIIMCGRSRIISVKQSETLDMREFCPATENIINQSWSIEDVLWVKDIFLELKKILEAKFALQPKLSRNMSEIIRRLLHDIPWDLPCVSPSIVSPRSYLKEFLLSPHKCAPLNNPRQPKVHILRTDEFYPSSSEVEDKEISWEYKLLSPIANKGLDSKNVALVGKLEVDDLTGHLVLDSGSCPIKCVFPGFSVHHLLNKLVAVTKVFQVVENCVLLSNKNEKEYNREIINYLLLEPENVHPIFGELENINETRKDGENQMKSKDNNLSWSLATDKINEGSQWLQKQIIVHHKSAVVYQTLEKQFYCLATLLENVEDPRKSNFVENSSSDRKLCLLCMKQDMVKYYPMLTENRIYEIRYPPSQRNNVFYKSDQLQALDVAKKYSPLLSIGVIIPNGCIIDGPINSPLIPEDSVVRKEAFGVQDSIKHVQNREIVHLQGIISSRTHQTPRFTQSNVCVTGFGSPGGKNIYILLKDFESDERVHIYIIKWTTKQYPLGLLPGAAVCIKFVEKRLSTKNNVFYQSTHLTCINILKHPTKCDPSKNMQSDDIKHSFLKQVRLKTTDLKSPFWAVLSIHKIWDLEITTKCSTCGFAVSKCRYNGCNCGFKKLVISAKANVTVDDGSDTAFLHLKDDHVRIILGLTEDEWESLGEIAKEKHMSYVWTSKRKEKNSSIEDIRHDTFMKDDDQLVLESFCENCVSTKSWHVLCRKFSDIEDGKKMRLFCINVEDFDFDKFEHSRQ